MKALIKAFRALVPVIIALNFAGGIVGAVWAAINSDWWAVGYVILGMVVSHFAISIALLPGIALGAVAASAMERGQTGTGRAVFAVSTLYTDALMLGWALFVTVAFLNHPRHSPLLPVLLLGYGSATGPWAFLSSKDQQGGGNEFSAVGVFLLQAGYIVSGTLLLLNPANGYFFLAPIAMAMGINWVFQQFVVAEMAKASAAG